MRARVGVDAGGEGLEIGSKRRILLREIAPGARRHVVDRHPAIVLELLGPVVLCRAPARLCVKPGQKVAMAARLRPAEAIEEVRNRSGIDMRHAIAVPENLGPVRRAIAGSAACARSPASHATPSSSTAALSAHPAPKRWHIQLPNACARSSTSSSVASMPTDMRISRSLMPSRRRSSADRPACEVIAGRVSSVSTPPRLGAHDRDLRAVHELLGALGRALELEAQHAAEALEQLACTRVARMAVEAGIVDPRHGSVRRRGISQSSSALWFCCRTRSASVLRPRYSRKAACGSIAPPR